MSNGILGDELNAHLARTFERRFQTVWSMHEKITRRADKAFVNSVKREIERCNGGFLPTSDQNARMCKIERSLKKKSRPVSVHKLIADRTNAAFKNHEYHSLEPEKRYRFLEYFEALAERDLTDDELRALQYLLHRLDDLQKSE